MKSAFSSCRLLTLLAPALAAPPDPTVNVERCRTSVRPAWGRRTSSPKRFRKLPLKMALSVLRRVMNIVRVKPLIAAIAA